MTPDTAVATDSRGRCYVLNVGQPHQQPAIEWRQPPRQLSPRVAQQTQHDSTRAGDAAAAAKIDTIVHIHGRDLSCQLVLHDGPLPEYSPSVTYDVYVDGSSQWMLAPGGRGVPLHTRAGWMSSNPKANLGPSGAAWAVYATHTGIHPIATFSTYCGPVNSNNVAEHVAPLLAVADM